MSTLANINDNPAGQADGHDARGRFKSGNKGGPGNPFAGQVAALRRAMLECITEEDIQAIFRSLVELAMEGHWQAAKLVLAYTIGKPQPFADSEAALEQILGVLPECGVAPLSTNGAIEEAPPSTNGAIEEAPPSTNGEIQETPPSTNGTLPPLNRKERRALRKTHRLAKQQRNSPKPASAV